MSPNTDIVARFYDAINHNDMQAVVQEFDPQIVRIEFGGTPISGIAAVRENITQGRGTWAEGRCDPEQFLENGDTVVVFVHAHVRLHGATEWTGGRFADGFVMQGGRIVAFHSFGERAEALAWAGIET